MKQPPPPPQGKGVSKTLLQKEKMPFKEKFLWVYLLYPFKEKFPYLRSILVLKSADALTLSQTSPGFYVSAVLVFQK